MQCLIRPKINNKPLCLRAFWADINNRERLFSACKLTIRVPRGGTSATTRGRQGECLTIQVPAVTVVVSAAGSTVRNRPAHRLPSMRVFDITFNYTLDTPPGMDPDSRSPRLKADHQLLWTKELGEGQLFALHVPEVPKVRRKNYLMFEQAPDKPLTFGSDAITNSYTRWGRPKALVEAKAQLSEEQKARYFDPPYTIGSAMIWPVRTIHLPTLNTARGMRPRIADRMDLTLECIRRHYAEEPGSPLADVITNYGDFFELFRTFEKFVEFFHFQDLVTPEGKIDLFLKEEDKDFTRSGVPATKDEYIKVREASLKFIALRGNRMADWVEENHPDIEVRRQ